MKQSVFQACSAKYFLLASVGMIVLATAPETMATSIIIENTKRYEGVGCDKLMAVYKRIYISVGFKFSSTEMLDKDTYLMSFTFPNPIEPNKPAGGGGFHFLLPKKNELTCNVSRYTLGVLGHYEAYTLEQHKEFRNIILAANVKAQALIAEEIAVLK